MMWGTLLGAWTMIATLTEPSTIALVIGADRGHALDSQLDFAEADARRMADVLRDVVDADVLILEQPSAETLDERLTDLRQRVGELKDAGRRVHLSVYYAGHADAEALHLGEARYELKRLESALAATPADIRLVVIDACRRYSSELQARGLTRVSGPDIEFKALPQQPHGTAWIQATSLGQVAHESTALRGGIFSHFWGAALRGAADANGDAHVTLSEAYSFAARHTHGYTARRAPHLPQQPTYNLELEGAQDLILARTNTAPSAIQLPQHPDAEYVIGLLPSGATLVVAEAKNAPRWVALPRGRFRILRRLPGSVSETSVQLPWGGKRVLEARAFGDTPETTITGRSRAGQSGPRNISHSLHLQSGFGHSAAVPQNWQRGRLVYGWNASRRWALRAGIAVQRRRFAISDGSRVQAQAFAGDLGAAWRAGRGQLETSLGLWGRFETIHQQAEVQPAIASRQAVRVGVLGEAALDWRLSRHWSWGISVLAGLMLGPGASGAVAPTPFWSLNTGPGVHW